jgi:hypothetical protein
MEDELFSSLRVAFTYTYFLSIFPRGERVGLFLAVYVYMVSFMHFMGGLWTVLLLNDV